jgi:HD superfamily phosphohydrolase
VTEIERLEIRLAALIHDWTHGPLSHTSESFYKSAPIFEAIKTYYPSLFRRASASEILTYCVITCDAFGEIWGELIERYARFPNDSLRRCDRWRIASMIVGSDNNAERPASSPQPFLRQLIHGPFDVDKLDYIARDGYFTGLSLPVDVERLLWVLETIKIGTGSDSQQFLCVSASGATVLEQVLFSKMHLFSSVYHHHKVRVAHQAALRLLSLLEEALVEINGLSLSNPETFLCLDDYDLLHGCFEINDKEKSEAAHALATAIKNRSLPRRALVLTHPAWGNDPSVGSDYDRQAWFNAMKSDDQPNRLVAQIAEKAGIDLTDIWVDIPDPVNLQGTGQEGMIKFDAKTFMPIQEMFPVGGWLSAYQSYRATSYIFSWRNQGKVGCVAREILRKEYGVTTNDVALKLAKLESED